jgi:hypothetical protein
MMRARLVPLWPQAVQILTCDYSIFAPFQLRAYGALHDGSARPTLGGWAWPVTLSAERNTMA